MINPLEKVDSMSFALYHSLAWIQPGLFASRWLQFNHSCIRNFQTGIQVGLSTCRQAHNKTSRNRCVNLPSATSSVRYIFSGKGNDERVRSLEDIARFIQDKECSRIVVMSGAGISTPSGIPDFRSSGSGLYDNLQQYDIPYPEAIFEINYFFHNPKPFFALARQLYPGNCKPNFTHYFVRFLHQKELLLRMYTQNIDGLERMAGIPPEKLVEAHGTFATATCTVCLENFSWEQLRVEPFASLSETVRKSVPRVLFNQDLVGSVTRNPLRVNDVVELGDIVGGVKKFSKMLGWNEEINDLLAREHAKLERDNIERSK
ncbi:NAD-dependent protein deacetylase sirtuin-3-like isoform X3 [Cetorhinus maximus]